MPLLGSEPLQRVPKVGKSNTQPELFGDVDDNSSDESRIRFS